MLQHALERMAPSLEMNSLTQVIYKRGLAFTDRNFKNLELLSLVFEVLRKECGYEQIGNSRTSQAPAADSNRVPGDSH